MEPGDKRFLAEQNKSRGSAGSYDLRELGTRVTGAPQKSGRQVKDFPDFLRAARSLMRDSRRRLSNKRNQQLAVPRPADAHPDIRLRKLRD